MQGWVVASKDQKKKSFGLAGLLHEISSKIFEDKISDHTIDTISIKQKRTSDLINDSFSEV